METSNIILKEEAIPEKFITASRPDSWFSSSTGALSFPIKGSYMKKAIAVPATTAIADLMSLLRSSRRCSANAICACGFFLRETLGFLGWRGWEGMGTLERTEEQASNVLNHTWCPHCFDSHSASPHPRWHGRFSDRWSTGICCVHPGRPTSKTAQSSSDRSSVSPWGRSRSEANPGQSLSSRLALMNRGRVAHPLGDSASL